MQPLRCLTASAALAVAAASLSLAGCDDDGSALSTDCSSGVEAGTVVAAVSSDVTEQLAALTTSTEALAASVGALLEDPSSEPALDGALQRFDQARLAFVRFEPYAFLVAQDDQPGRQLNGFPADTAALEAYLAGGAFDPEAPAAFDRGFPALEYYLHAGAASRPALQVRLTGDDAFRAALRATADAASAYAAQLNADWIAEERSTLAEASGTAAGSGLSRVLNSLSKHYEDLRRDRLGLPLGVALGFPSPQVVESPYAERSLTYLRVGIESSAAAFSTASGDNTPLGAYFAELANPAGSDLLRDIREQYGEALSALAEVDAPLSTAVEDERDDVQALYNAVSAQVVNLKTDLPALACVSITYVDNPSDSD